MVGCKKAGVPPGHLLFHVSTFCRCISGSVADALPDHRVGHLHEARDVGAGHQIALHAVLGGGVGGVVVDVAHDGVQLLVNLLEAPAQAHGVLAHLQAGGGHAAGVGRLGGGEEDAVLLVTPAEKISFILS